MEQYNGTNAIGTALATGKAIEVGRDEHYLVANRYMSASAAPIFDSRREVVGVLNISSDAYLPTTHVNGMVRVMTQAVENQLIIATYRQHYYLFIFNTNPDNIDSQWSGLLVFDEEGRIVASNRRADLLMGTELKGLAIEQVTGIKPLQLSAHPERQVLNFNCLANYPLFAVIRKPAVSQARGSVADIRKHRAVKDARQPKISPQDFGDPQALMSLALGDQKMQRAVEQGLNVVHSDIPLLIQGETGVGKEVFVTAFHASSPRSDKELVAVNCAAIPTELVESELFGYVKGAFTGANQKGSTGHIRRADGGTLFLDEIGDMPLNVQARLLRVLQEKRVTPLGSSESYPVDFRLVCATHQPLRNLVKQQRFRDDLYYRVNGLTVFLPSLREREDLRSLAETVLRSLDEYDGQTEISEEVFNLFESHNWPGNIRQLYNVLRVATVMSAGDEISPHHLPDDFYLDLQASVSETDDVDIQVEEDADWRESLPKVYAAFGGNISKTASALGVSRNTIYKRLKDLGVK